MRLKGSEINAAAAHELALRVGGELRQLDQEMDKLLAHTNYQGPVTLEAVRNLVSSSQSPRIFALVDAMGMRQGGQALRHLHELLESGAAPLYLLSMIERQFRILLQAKELMGQGATVQSTQKALGINQRFVVEKSLRQASRFTEERLASIHQYLANVEFSIKSGEISEILALDLLVMDICT
jgi:DNA polymerase-3 subunit delta